nr:MAG TPA: hypothetical protein [Caudoviricetes sp.]
MVVLKQLWKIILQNHFRRMYIHAVNVVVLSWKVNGI